MPWPDFQYDQENLALLCQDWPVDAAEYHAQNSLYGFNWLLKEYAGLSANEPLPWAMEHAISFDNPEPYFAEAESCLPIILAITEAQAETLRAKVDARVEAIGSAYFYMKEALRRDGREGEDLAVERRGTIVFPDKSTRNQDTDYDRAAFAEWLAKLPEEYQPVYVSIFWRDYERETHLPFADAGLRLVSSGNPYDPQFLFRQEDLCRRFKYSCANDLSTSFCLSILGGCQFFHHGTGPLTMRRGGETIEYEREPTLHLPEKRRCIDASPFPPIENCEEQRQLAADFAGEASVRPPEFFRELAREGHRLLRKAVPSSVSLGLVQSLDHLAQWQPRAIDNDGWAQSRSGFVIPWREGFAGVALKIGIPARAEGPEWESDWLITLDGKESYAFPAQGGEFEIEIPVHPKEKRRTVFIESTDPVALLHEARERTFRVTEIAWVEELQEPVLSWGRKVEENGEFLPLPTPESVDFTGDPPPMGKRLGWQLKGINQRGWVRKRASLVVPPATDWAGIRIKIRARSRDSETWRAHLAVSIPPLDAKEVTSEIDGDSFYLEVPTSGEGDPVPVQLAWVSSDDPPGDCEAIRGEPAPPNFRIQRIEWRSQLASRNLPGTEERLRFRKLEELKEISKRTSKKSLWKSLVSRFT